MTYVLGHDSHGHQITSKNGCSGSITIPVDGEHDDAANIFAVFDAEYTDAGGLTTHTQHTLQPRHRQAEHYKTSSGVATFDKTTAEGGKTVGDIDNGDWIAFDAVPAEQRHLVHRPGLLGRRRRHAPDPGRLGRPAPCSARPPSRSPAAGTTFTTVTGTVSGAPAGTTTLYLTFAGGTGPLFDLDAFTFTTGTQPPPGTGPIVGLGGQVPGRAQRRHRRRHADPDLHLQRRRPAQTWTVTPGPTDQGARQVPGRQRRRHRQRHQDPALDLQRRRRPELAGAGRRHAAQPAVGQVPGRLGQQLRRRHRSSLCGPATAAPTRSGPCPDLSAGTARPAAPRDWSMRRLSDPSSARLPPPRRHRLRHRQPPPAPPTPPTTCWSSPRPPASGTTRSPAGIQAIRDLGAANSFTVTATEDAAAFTTANLAQYEAVVFLNTTGDVLNATQQTAFESLHRRAAAATSACTRPPTPSTTGRSTATWSARTSPRTRRSSRPTSRSRTGRTRPPRTCRRPGPAPTSGTTTAPTPRPPRTCWPPSTSRRTRAARWAPTTRTPGARRYGGGRSFYTGGGHTQASYAEPAFRAHLLGGIRYAAGRTKADCRPETGYTALYNGSTTGWSQAGPGSFTNSDATLTSIGGMGLLWYSAKQFTNYSLKLDWKMAGDDNSGVFIGFPPSSDPWSAVNNGYEIQIDATDAADRTTGSIYTVQVRRHRRPGRGAQPAGGVEHLRAAGRGRAAAGLPQRREDQRLHQHRPGPLARRPHRHPEPRHGRRRVVPQRPDQGAGRYRADSRRGSDRGARR